VAFYYNSQLPSLKKDPNFPAFEKPTPKEVCATHAKNHTTGATDEGSKVCSVQKVETYIEMFTFKKRWAIFEGNAIII